MAALQVRHPRFPMHAAATEIAHTGPAMAERTTLHCRSEGPLLAADATAGCKNEAMLPPALTAPVKPLALAGLSVDDAPACPCTALASACHVSAAATPAAHSGRQHSRGSTSAALHIQLRSRRQGLRTEQLPAVPRFAWHPEQLLLPTKFVEATEKAPHHPLEG